jgi:leucyl aminopeptidase
MIPISTPIKLSLSAKIPANVDAVAVFAIAKTDEALQATQLAADDRAAANRLLTSGVAKAKVNEVVFDIVHTAKGKFRRVLLVGLGPAEKVTTDTYRTAGAALAKAIRKHKLTSVAVVAPKDQVEAVTTGLVLASFDYREYKGTAHRKKGDPEPKDPVITVVSTDSRGYERAVAVTIGQNFARTIASRPGNDINPPELARVTAAMAREVGLKCKVLDEKQMKKLGMGGILAVGAANKLTPPRMIVLEWAGKGKAAPLLAVGKAITFDTGGISIKPAERMGRMIYDKCGGMAVLGFMLAVAKLKLQRRVIGILASAENHISDTAMRPGDILTFYNGVTAEITNTDAEGRLVLGDALAWGIEQYKPAQVVDLATLTGGVVVALGKTMAGVMANDDKIVADLQKAANAAGEKFWRLPLGDDQRDQMKSDHADLVNSGGREGHPLQGGAFLSYFVPEGTPWAHLDIAGVADTERELPLYGKGATGWGVRTLVEWASK